jgi:hypothetical protein
MTFTVAQSGIDCGKPLTVENPPQRCTASLMAPFRKWQFAATLT